MWHCTEGVLLPTAPRQCGGALKESNCLLLHGSVAVHRRSPTAHGSLALSRAGVPLVVVQPGRQGEKPVAWLSGVVVPLVGATATEWHRAVSSPWEERGWGNGVQQRNFQGGSGSPPPTSRPCNNMALFRPLGHVCELERFFPGVVRSPAWIPPHVTPCGHGRLWAQALPCGSDRTLGVHRGKFRDVQR